MITMPRRRPSSPRVVGPVMLVALALGVPAGRADGQIGVAIGTRGVTSAQVSEGPTEYRGIEFRGFIDRPFGREGAEPAPLGARLELGYTQMRKPRTDGLGRYEVNENGFELGVLARLQARLALAQTYVLAGPVLSFRAACGVDSLVDSNGRVPCAGESTSSLGGTLGLGVRGSSDGSMDWLGEVRLMRGTVNAAGGTLISIGVGVQRR